MLFAIVKLHMVNRTFAGKFERTAVFLFYAVLVITFAVTVHGKAGFTGGNTDGKESGVFCIAPVKRNDAFPVIEFTDLIVNVFYIIAFVGKKGTLRDRQEAVGFCKDIGSDCGICHIGSCGYFADGETGNTVHKDMVFVTPVEFIVLFVSLVGSRMYTKFTVLICFWLVVRLKLVGKERLWIVLRCIGRNRGRVQSDERGIYDAFCSKGEDLCLHDTGQDIMVKVIQETVKCPVRGKRQRNIKTAIVGDEKVIIEIIDKVSDHGKTFTFHDNKGTDQGMIGKAFAPGFWVFLNGR